MLQGCASFLLGHASYRGLCPAMLVIALPASLRGMLRNSPTKHGSRRLSRPSFGPRRVQVHRHAWPVTDAAACPRALYASLQLLHDLATVPAKHCGGSRLHLLVRALFSRCGSCATGMLRNSPTAADVVASPTSPLRLSRPSCDWLQSLLSCIACSGAGGEPMLQGRATVRLSATVFDYYFSWLQRGRRRLHVSSAPGA